MNAFACLALVSLVAFLGVVALAEALHGVGTAWGRDGDPWHGMAGDAHPLDCVEAMALSRTARGDGGGGMVSNHRLVLFTHALCRLSYPATKFINAVPSMNVPDDSACLNCTERQ